MPNLRHLIHKEYMGSLKERTYRDFARNQAEDVNAQAGNGLLSNRQWHLLNDQES